MRTLPNASTEVVFDMVSSSQTINEQLCIKFSSIALFLRTTISIQIYINGEINDE